ncbi:MAG: ion transporter [Gammaproteobacteria bacterium]|nr:ion transporter [Gammaproteobacteria bacterium]|tara:strand:- start:1010 stop:1810 length:801 start_codon:yes stop_codon:yes gene_type:complete
MQARAAQIVNSQWFHWLIIGLILLTALLVGLETSDTVMAEYEPLLLWLNQAILAVFVIEAILKIIAVWPEPGKYFKEGWNLFDFTIVVFSLLPATGEFAMVARLMRLLRVVRLISAIPELRLIVTTLINSIPSMLHVVLLMSIIFYIYAVIGYHLFHDHDPTHWRTLGLALLTLFRVVTLEDWTDVMYTAMEWNPYAWIYFVSFVVVGTFVVVNLFIAVVLNNLDEAKQERLKELSPVPSRDELLREVRATQETLKRLHDRLEKLE